MQRSANAEGCDVELRVHRQEELRNSTGHCRCYRRGCFDDLTYRHWMCGMGRVSVLCHRALVIHAGLESNRFGLSVSSPLSRCHYKLLGEEGSLQAVTMP